MEFGSLKNDLKNNITQVKQFKNSYIMKNSKLLFSNLLVLLLSNFITLPTYAVPAQQTLNGGVATLDCLPNSGLALWSLDTFDDLMYFLNYEVRFSNGAVFPQAYFVVPSFSEEGAEGSSDPTEQWATYNGSAVGSVTYYTIPAFQSNCN